MKNSLFAIAFLFLSLSVKAQSLQVKDLSSSFGNWEGTLTYMDYSSGKPYTMLANIKIELTADNKGFVVGYEYPREPQANSKDTTYIIGNYFGKDKIVEFKKDTNGGFKMITEINGNDGNDNKRAVLRYTYLLKSNTFSIIKEVKFEGTNKWIKRNKYYQNKLSSKVFKPIEVYHSDNLIVVQVAENSFVHTSNLQTNDFGNVPCNGIIVRDNNESIVFDTPTNDKSADELIKFVKEKLYCKINAIVPTHFHDDCLGGLAAFHKLKISSFGNFSTIELAKANNTIAPQTGFIDSLKLNLGNAYVDVKYFGQGHTKDNVVGYFPKDSILFGGCLIKELQASKGYLGDANVGEWSNTVEKVKQQYPKVKIVIPGHGEIGGKELLDYTIQLFKSN